MRHEVQHTHPQADTPTLYLGLDVHKLSVNVTVYDSTRRQGKAHVPMQELEAYVAGIKKQHPEHQLVAAYEAGFCGFALQRRLSAQQVQTLVVNAADIPTTDKDRTTKTDRADSAKIANSLRSGLLTGIWVPSEELEGDRELVRDRLKIRSELKAIKNAVKMRLHKHGITIPARFDNASWSAAFRQWLAEQQMESPSAQRAFELLLAEYDHRCERHQHHVKILRDLAASPRYATTMQLLTSIPSIGLLSGMSLATEIGPISRFPSADHLASYVGLVPMQHQSGSSNRQMPIQRRAQSELRSMLIQSAWTAIRTDTHFEDLYKRKRASKPGQKAIVVVARRLLNTVYAILKHQEPYCPSKQG